MSNNEKPVYRLESTSVTSEEARFLAQIDTVIEAINKPVTPETPFIPQLRGH